METGVAVAYLTLSWLECPLYCALILELISSVFVVFWQRLSFFELVNIWHGSLCHVLCLFPLLNMWPLWGQVYFCPVPSSQTNKVLLFSPPPVRLQALRSDSCRKYLTTKQHTQKTSYLLWSQKKKAAVPLSNCGIQFLQTSGLSLMIQSSAPHLSVSPLSIFSFCFVVVLFYFMLSSCMHQVQFSLRMHCSSFWGEYLSFLPYPLL